MNTSTTAYYPRDTDWETDTSDQPETPYEDTGAADREALEAHRRMVEG